MDEKLENIENNNTQGISYKYALCIVDVNKMGTRTFSYLIPEHIKPKIRVGQAVLVPFGRRKQNIIAFVTGFSNYLQEGIQAKEIVKIIDRRSVFNLDYLKMLDWVANYYCCDINAVIQAAVPMRFLKENSGKTQKERKEKFVIFKTKEGATSKQLKILEKLEEYGEKQLIEFEKEVKTTRQTMLRLEEHGCVEIDERPIYRDPLSVFKNIEKDEFPPLSEEQQKVFENIVKRMDEKQTKPILLNGITGSGKTEIYFKAMKKVLDEGKNVLFLAPEIALASQLTLRMIRRFNPEEIAIWHSSISEGEKFDVWNKLRDNKIRIIVGARSAVFAPLNNIGLVIIDEEHENTYKQTSPAPRYDARLVAEKICEINNATLIKGSATPDVSSYFKALSMDSLITLENRFNNVDLAKVTVIDMREEFYRESRSIFSNTMVNAINLALKDKKQVMLLLNRRGFYTSVQCRTCGETIKCPNCDIPMIYHSEDKTIKCHWCDTSKKVPDLCPKCGSPEIKMTGMGTQRIENITAKLFPNAKVERIDSDALSSKTKYIDILDRFQNGEIDILIGTQIIAKGLDNKNVTVVGVVDADISFALPDYRSSERGFQLLMQVAGRAGRGEDTGRVIFQTYNPELYAIENAKAQNYLDFYKNEINRREMFDYPPFCQIIKIVISSNDEARAAICANEIAERIKAQLEKLKVTEYIEVLGSMKCIMPKINSEYRYQIVFKNKMNKKGQYLISTFIKNTSAADDIKLVIDVDPVDII
ncbi:MAG: primosomal protein N' [Candidatus Gastranaerophilales bacterium]|nr:primosomal protein N' [Candidatus Gastranaerophilales bacterium]